MKKSIFHILAVAFAGLSFSACQSEFKAPDASATHTVVFSAEQVATKTGLSIDGTAVHYAWKQSDTEGDKFKVFENGVEADLVVPELKDGKMSITATFPGEETPANAKYLARFNSGVNASQFGDETEYAQDSDVLVSEEAEGDISGEGILFRFTRVSAFGQMTLKNLGKGEFVNSVTIETTDGKILAAEYDFANNQFAAEGSATLNIETLSTIANNQAVVRFVTVPVQDAMLKITATTIDGDENVVATYEKTFTKSISFSAGDLFAFGALMEEKSSEPSNKFIKVTSEPDTWVGEYLIAYCPDASTARVFNGLDAANDYVEAAITDDAIELEDGMAIISIESVTGGYSLKIVGGDKDGNYICGTDGSNTIKYGSSAVANELSFGNEAITISSNSTTFRYNSASGNNRFRYFKISTTGSTYILPTLFKREGEIQKIAVTGVTVAPATVSIEEGTITTLTATVAPDDATDKSVTWESDDTSVATVDGNGLVTAIAAGTATITATTTDGGHTATCEVTVYAQVINEVSIAEFLAAEVGGTEWYKLTGEITKIDNIKYGNFTIQDASGEVYVYGLANSKGSDDVAFSEHEINEGDIITIIGKRGVHEDTQEVVDAYYVSHTPAPSISLNPTSLNFVAAGESKDVVATAQNFAGNVTITAESDNEQFTTSVSDATVTITAAENTSTSDVTGTVTITATDGTSTKSADVTLTQYGKVVVVDAVDVINREFTGVSNGATTYADWSNKTSNSTARYSGNSAGSNDAIQLRSDKSSSGIITTASGGYLTKVAVEWESHTASGRKVQIYGSNTAYGSPTDLYDSNKQGTLLGTIDYGSTTELNISGEYQYFGIRSASGALYLTSISITWSATAPEPPVLTDLTWTGYKSSYTVGDTFEIDGTIKAVYDNGNEVALTADDVTLTVSPNLTVAGTTSATISYTEGEVTKTATADITVAAAGTVKEYTLVINTTNFKALTTGSGYTPYNGTHTFTATAQDGSTMSVSIESYQVMIQSSKLQGQKNSGYLYNKTDLKEIVSVSFDTNVNFSYIVGSTENPSASGKGGYFKISAGSATSTAASITIVFKS